MKRQWYRISAQAEPQVADLFVYDEIGKSWLNDDAVSALEFIAAIRALPAAVTTLRIHVNSPGGNPFEATAIANALRAENREHGRTIEVLIEGLAASAATIVTSAGDRIKIADNAIFMVHEPHALAMGTARDMRSMAEALDQVRDAIVATYRWVSSLSVEAIAELMAATTWMGASDTVKNGFATEVIPGVAVEARFQPEALGRLGTIPDAYRERIAAFAAERPVAAAQQLVPREQMNAAITAAVKAGLVRGDLEAAMAAHFPSAAPAAPAAVLKLCREAGILALAEPLMEAQADEAMVTARIAMAKEIRVICKAGKLEDLAEDYILAGTPKATVQKQVTLFSAKLDRVEIDAGLKPDAGTHQKPTIDTAAIYAARNAPQGAGR